MNYRAMAEDKARKSIKIVTVRPENSTRIYSNYVEVSTSEIDMSFKFADIKPMSQEEVDEAKAINTQKGNVVAEIVLPLAVGQSLYQILFRMFGKINTVEKKGK